MNGSSKTWWEDPQTDWTSGEPARVVELLARAYEHPSAIKPIVDAAGLDWDGAPIADSAREMWTWALRQAIRKDRVLDLVAEVLQDNYSAAFHGLLGTLFGDRLGEANARRMLRYGLPPSPEVQDQMLESVVLASTDPGDQPVSGLQAITSATAAMGDPRAYVQAVFDAMRRTAMIQVAGRPRGTGLLVGADLVLTAAHVIDESHWPPDPQPQVVAVFDYSSMPGRSPAETGTRIPVAKFVTGSLPTSAEVGGKVIDWDAPSDRLDFALLKLTSAVPPFRDAGGAWERGWYSLDSTTYEFTGNSIFLIFQHSLGEFQQFSFIANTPQRNQSGTRIRYKGNTLAGSSGSPVIDIRGRLVAVHHYAQDGNNQGVPFSVIAETLLNGPHAGLFTATPEAQPTPAAPATVQFDPFMTNELMGLLPFVNRDNLRERIRRMAKQGPRMLAITGESGSGVSYSYMLASHVAAVSKAYEPLRAVAPDGLATFIVDLRDYIALGVEERRDQIIEFILINLGMHTPSEPLAQAARNITTFRAWVTWTLRRSPQQWWIFFDSIDNLVAVKQGAVDELIHAMITVANDPQVPMRVVLAGREAELLANEHAAWLETDTAEGLLRSHVEGWLRARADEEHRTIDEGRLADELAQLFPDGEPLPPPSRIAPRLPVVLLNVLDGASRG